MIKPIALPFANAARRRKKSAFTENRLLLLVWAVVMILIVTTTDCEIFAISVFSLSWAIFIFERALLGDSLSMKYLTLPSFFLLCYSMALAIPSVWMFADIQNSIRFTYLLALESVMVTFPLGVGLANMLFRNPAQTIREYALQPLRKTPEDFKFSSAFLILMVATVPLLLPYFVLSPHIQLFEVLKAYPTPIDPTALRFAESDLPHVVEYSFEIARRFVLPFCALYAFFMARAYKGKWGFLFWTLFIGTMGTSLLTLDRAEPFVFCIMLVIGHVLMRQASLLKAIRNPKAIIGLGVGIVLAGVISITQYQSTFTLERVIGDVWHVATYRLFQSPSIMASQAFIRYDISSLFEHGRYERVFSFLPGHVYATSQNAESSIVAPLTFVGNLWGNWGWVGVIAGTIIIGFVYQTVQLTLFVRKSAPILALQVILLCNAVWIIWGKALSVMSLSALVFGTIFGLFMRGRRPGEKKSLPQTRYASFPKQPNRPPLVDTGA